MLGMSLCLPFVRYADDSMINRLIHSIILTENAFDHYDRSYNMKNMTHEKDIMLFLIFTTKSCWFNNKVVFLRRKDLNRDDYERFYFKKRVLRL